MPRSMKDETFDKFFDWISFFDDPRQWLVGKTSSQVYRLYCMSGTATLSQSAVSRRLMKIYGEWLHLEMQYNEDKHISERRWVWND